MKKEVCILGGGLAGLTLGIQLLKNGVKSVVAIDKLSYPLPEATVKVGESTVEIGSHYYSEILGLKDHILKHQLPKLGLRFFFSKEGNASLQKRSECGPSIYSTVPSYQLDRGRFENFLMTEFQRLGGTFLAQTKVEDVEKKEDGSYAVKIKKGAEEQILLSTWVVDATSRYSLLKKKYKLLRSTDHNINATWFRVNQAVNIDTWEDDEDWKNRTKLRARRFSTNHLFGTGYWTWIIPLASGATSIGIVADETIHPFSTVNTLEKSMAWLKQYEPQLHAHLNDGQIEVMDFLALKHFSHHAKQVFSVEKWALTGEAGVFLDPFYSPGSDFIGMSNTFLTDLITRSLKGEEIEQRAKTFNTFYLAVFTSFLTIYENQYPMMGNALLMTLKINWDYIVYWASMGLVFFNEKLADPEVLTLLQPVLYKINQLNVTMHTFFTETHKLTPESLKLGAFDHLDYAKLDSVRIYNKGLQEKFEIPALIAKIEENYADLKQISATIIQEVGKLIPEIQSMSFYPKEAFEPKEASAKLVQHLSGSKAHLDLFSTLGQN